ncbi:MAG: SDR family NAD(P)-dependent oxidoreductase [Gammaproteobacteria bacterium]|nr:SDR family NAD(P)-dependent oxidoreductase [Gammaproteobacteria bacterium]
MDSTAEVKSVLITGCSTGIGLHLAYGLKKKGYRVFASARKEADVRKLQAEGFESLLLDLSSSDSIRGAIRELFQKTDSLYALINNGAYGQAGALEDISRVAMEEQFQANFFGWHELTNLVLPSMKKDCSGRLIYISSVLGFVALPFRGPYIASKFAIEGLVDTLRLELRHTNIKLSLVQPGPIESDFRQNAYLSFQKHVDLESSDYREDYVKMIKRLNSPDNAQFTLGPESVLKPVLHALESKSPKLRYRVTFPTKLFAILGRILPSVWMDRILSKAAD